MFNVYTTTLSGDKSVLKLDRSHLDHYFNGVVGAGSVTELTSQYFMQLATVRSVPAWDLAEHSAEGSILRD